MVNNMALQIGQINKLTVKRETDISYTLSDGYEEVFLHFNQTPRKLNENEEVLAFLYYDQKKRLCATLEKPLITTTTYGFVKVVDINEAGVFVNIGINKDILLSKDFLTINQKAWPIVGDSLPCTLKVKSDQLVARIINKADRIYGPHNYEINDIITGVVSHISPEGYGVYTSEFDFIFIHRSLTRKNYRLGETISPKIINVNANDEYNGTMIEQKEVTRISDSDYLLNYMRSRGNIMNLGNASEPAEIMKEVHMSKSAFKRALGHLYKLRLVEISDYKTILNEE